MIPVPFPALDDHRILLPPRTGGERFELSPRFFCVDSTVDRAQRCGQGLTLLPTGKVHRVTKQMHDARLDTSLRKHGFNRFGKALEAIDHRNEDIFRASNADIVHHAEPELGSLGLLDPKAQDLFVGASIGSQWPDRPICS